MTTTIAGPIDTVQVQRCMKRLIDTIRAGKFNDAVAAMALKLLLDLFAQQGVVPPMVIYGEEVK